MLRSSRIVTDVTELDEYSKCYRRSGGVPVEPAFLGQCRVRGFFARGGDLVGGYALHSGPSLRHLEALPPDAPDPFASLPRDQFIEITCIWMDPRLTVLDRVILYAHTMYDFAMSGHRYLMAGTISPKLSRHYPRALPYVLYDGPLDVHGERVHGWIFYGTVATTLRCLATELPRRIGSRYHIPRLAPRA